MYISKYEYARIMSARVTALANNAPSPIGDEIADCPSRLLALAEREFAQGVLQLTLHRSLPWGATTSIAASSLSLNPTRTASFAQTDAPIVAPLDANVEQQQARVASCACAAPQTEQITESKKRKRKGGPVASRSFA